MKKTSKVMGILMIAVMVGITVSAAASFKFNVTPSATSAKEGDEITIDLNISDIDIGENGMNTVEGVLEYDKNVFEAVSTSDVTSLNNWSITYNAEAGNAQNGKFLAVNLSQGVKSAQTIGKIKLKVKTAIQSTAAKITFKNIATTDGTNEIKEQNKTITVNVTGTVVAKPDENTNTNINAGTNENTQNKAKNITPSPTKTKLPAAGEMNIYAIIVSIVAIIMVIGVICFIRYRNIDK